MVPLCAQCGKPKRSSIFEPCSYCGYEHPLTEEGQRAKEKYLKEKEAERTRNE